MEEIYEQQVIREISIDWTKISRNSYLRIIPSLWFEGPIEFDASVTFLVGENGTGKFTLLEGIAIAASRCENLLL